MEDMIFSPSNHPLMSADIRHILSALIDAKKGFTSTGLDGKVTHQGGYKYAKIDGIFNAVEESLNLHGIWIYQGAHTLPDQLPNKIEILHSRLIHKDSGQFIGDERYLESEKPGNQAKGSANTYMRKYAVLTLCGLCPDDDDSGEEQKYLESKKAEKSKPPRKDVKDVKETSEDVSCYDLYEELRQIIKQEPENKKIYAHLLRVTGLKSIDEIPKNEVEHWIDHIKMQITLNKNNGK